MIYHYNKDCLPALKLMPDKSIDLAIVDPPYGINAPNLMMGSNPNRKDSKGNLSTAVKVKGRLNSGGGKLKNRMLNKSNISWDNEIPPPEYFTELFRVCKNVIIFGGNYFPLPPTRGIICWDKCQPWENFSQWEMAWTSFDCPAGLFKYSNTGGKNKKPKIHPTEKPVALYEYLLKRFAKPGDKILDTHGGSFNHAIACYNLGYDIYIYEISAEYYKDGVDNVETHIKNHSPATESAADAVGNLKLF